jgi:hypothetical protein
MVRIFFGLILILMWLQTEAQQESLMVQGSVSYITSQNVYVRFTSTENIAVGDTFFVNHNQTIQAALMVIQKSSTSCITKALYDFQPAVGQGVLCKIVNDNKKNKEGNNNKVATKIETTAKDVTYTVTPSNRLLENLKGSISASSYSYINSGQNTRHTEMMRLALQMQHIDDSKFSVETYMNYRKNFGRVSSVEGNKTAYFNIYNLAIKYEPDSTWLLCLGRQINRNFSSVGAIDGFQAEKNWKTFFVGAITGFRPDMYTYKFNVNLLEYGGYGGYKLKLKNGTNETTLGLMEQRNSGNVDRRFAFAQSSLRYKKLYLFSSGELDLYKNINGVASTSPRLTNFYVSSQYRINRFVSFNLSYDNRKRIMYYDTEKEFVETWLLDDVARQGAKAGIRIQAIKNMTVGGSYGYRFQNNNASKSQNINGYVSYYNLPLVRGSVSLGYSNNTSNYMKSISYVLRHSRSLYREIVYANVYARWVSYTYLNSDDSSPLNQAYFGCDIDVMITKKLRAGIMGEINNFQNKNDFRINLQVIKRF